MQKASPPPSASNGYTHEASAKVRAEETAVRHPNVGGAGWQAKATLAAIVARTGDTTSHRAANHQSGEEPGGGIPSYQETLDAYEGNHGKSLREEFLERCRAAEHEQDTLKERTGLWTEFWSVIRPWSELQIVLNPMWLVAWAVLVASVAVLRVIT